MKNYFKVLIFLMLLYNNAFSQNYESTIGDIKGYLFYNFNNDDSEKKVAGTFSENIIDNINMDLWNSTIGEGSAEGSSNQTLIVIQINNTIGEYEEKILKIVIKSEGKIILEQRNKFAAISKDGKYYHSLILNDTGCKEIEISAEIFADKNSKIIESSMEKKINFSCGEERN